MSSKHCPKIGGGRGYILSDNGLFIADILDTLYHFLKKSEEQQEQKVLLEEEVGGHGDGYSI